MRNHIFGGLAVAALAACLAMSSTAQAAGVTADVAVRVSGSYVGSNAIGSVAFGFDEKFVAALSAGVGVGQADKAFGDTRSIAASSSANLDLAGSLPDAFGATLTFGHVKLILVRAAATNVNDFCIGGAGANAFLGPFGSATDVVCIKPGAVFLATHPGAGWPVTAGTGDLLKTANSGATTAVSADVLILGTSS